MRFTESYKVELKTEITNNLKKEVVAVVNCDGGDIHIGVNDFGEIVGVDNADRQAESVSNMIRDGIKPDLTAYTRTSVVEENPMQIIHIEVQSGLKKPYHLTEKGLKLSGVFIRHGTVLSPANDELIR